MLPRRALLLPLALAACGSDEPAQRRAFIAFLQARILDRPGLRVPTPTPDEAKSFGDYAKHYAVIATFNAELSARVSKPMQDAVQRGAVRSLDDLLARRAEVADVRAGMKAFAAELDAQAAAADAARARLDQPADLKPVFDAAYERTVTGPARAFREVFPVADTALGSALDLAAYVAQNRAKVTVQGANIEVSDPAVRRELNTRITAMQAEQSKVLAAQRRLQALVTGG